MTREPCFDPADAARIHGLPEDNPERVHARGCPRCSALLDAYRAFLEADASAVAAAELAAANSRLTRAIRAATGDETARVARAPAGAAAPRPWWRRPAVHPAWAVVTLAAIAGAMLLWPRPVGHDVPLVLRGGEPAARPEIVAGAWTGGTLSLSWRGVPGADGYAARFYSTALAELGASGPWRDSSVTIALAALPFRSTFGDSVVVRLEALRAGDVVAVSDAKLIARAAPR